MGRSLSFVITTGLCTNPVATDNSLFGQVCFVWGTVPFLGRGITMATGQGRSFQGQFGVPSFLSLKNLKQGLRDRRNPPPNSDAPSV